MPTASDVERVLRAAARRVGRARVAVPAASGTAGSEMDEAEISCWGRCPPRDAAESPAVGS